MNALPSAGGGHGALHLLPEGCNVVSEFLPLTAGSVVNKRKRRPAGTPDPGAEVVALSPKTLMESDRYVCEICNQGFQRDQNLQMHRRRHKVPWKLLKRPSLGTLKRVYVCPERSCLHHDPSHALGDLVGIKKHYRRKHCTEKQWKCDKCSKGYAVQSDYKAHLKTCGTRGHCCDCGRVFSRVESFIEHQDTCSAVKYKSMHSGDGSERKLSLQRQATDRNSNESPSQSSDTTQAMSFAQSGMSDTAARSADSTKVIDHEHSRRIQESQAAYNAVLPGWLLDQRKELELLPWKQRPPESVHPDVLTSGSTMQGDRRVVQPSHGSRSQVTLCSSINSVHPEVSCMGSKAISPSKCSEDVNAPSLALSIGLFGAEVGSSTPSPIVDMKPSFSSVEREVLALTYQQRQGSAGIPKIGTSSRSGAPLGNDLALSMFPTNLVQTRNQVAIDSAATGTDAAVSLSDFLMQAARRLGPSLTHSNAADYSELKAQETSSRTEMVLNYNHGVGSTSSCHEDRAGKAHESDLSGLRPVRRGALQHSQFEPATSMVRSRQATIDHTDVTETHEIFTSAHSIDINVSRSQKQMAAAGTRGDQACEQTWTDMSTAWSDPATARRTKHQTRQESEEAEKELARAEVLKREAREQLQLASAEREYADRAREVAKRQIELSEADLAKAKRIREHAQAELEKAQFLKERVERSVGASASSQDSSQFSFCHSCKSAIEVNASIRTPTSSPGSSSWSFVTPPTSNCEQLQVGPGKSGISSGQIFMVPGSHEGGAKQADPSCKLLSGRMSWTDTISARLPVSSEEGRKHIWPVGTTSMSTFATSMAVEEASQSEENLVAAAAGSTWRRESIGAWG
uniref:C2H2-type domain-containing protein n=2 Tax=Physcomitrium patens TaxID=3218 RepID=A0A7I4DRY7_PHYPA